jgi:aminoglycoside 6'-N-acetyltransferase I
MIGSNASSRSKPVTGDCLTVTRVRSATAEDASSWLAMRLALWPDGSEAEHREEIDRFMAGQAGGRPAEVLVAEDPSGVIVGFAELAIRPYAEGCLTDRVAYLEGWFVELDRRKEGLGRALVTAAEDWGRAQGCTEFASDADPGNDVSIQAHRALGFADAGLVRCFHKNLTG